MGKISLKALDNDNGKTELSYQKKRWKEWCVLHHKDENGTLKVRVENTSFTGNDGCEVIWTLAINRKSDVHLMQDAGTIDGIGSFNKLNIELAAGNITWEKSAQTLNIQVSAGNVKFLQTDFPAEGKSKISVATGNVTVTSFKDTKVSTILSTAVGPESNDFSEKDKGHTLEINVALGNASHKFD